MGKTWKDSKGFKNEKNKTFENKNFKKKFKYKSGIELQSERHIKYDSSEDN